MANHPQNEDECVTSVALIEASAVDVVTLAEVKSHLRVDFADDDDLINGLIAAAVGQLDPSMGGWLGRALRPQTWEYRLDRFYGLGRHHRNRGGHHRIEIPYPPLIGIVSLKYDDPAGVEQSLVEGTDFQILGEGSLGRASIAPLYDGCWPVARCAPESVRIRFQAGYAAAVAADPGPASPDALPPTIKAWLKLIIGSLYENRESMMSGARAQVAQLPDHILQMISPYRVYG